jgi:protein-tyrosine phosphatase
VSSVALDRPHAFTVLTICTGNICRSPFAEAALRSRVIEHATLSFRSAGTHADNGRLAPPQAHALASTHGLSLETHRARYLDAESLAGVNLVLALAREHRKATVEVSPRATRFTFTLTEFARLVESIQSDELQAATAPHNDEHARLTAAVALAASHRGSLPPVGDADDVVDPFGQRDSVYDAMAAQILPATESVARYLAAAISPA